MVGGATEPSACPTLTCTHQCGPPRAFLPRRLRIFGPADSPAAAAESGGGEREDQAVATVIGLSYTLPLLARLNHSASSSTLLEQAEKAWCERARDDEFSLPFSTWSAHAAECSSAAERSPAPAYSLHYGRAWFDENEPPPTEIGLFSMFGKIKGKPPEPQRCNESTSETPQIAAAEKYRCIDARTSRSCCNESGERPDLVCWFVSPQRQQGGRGLFGRRDRRTAIYLGSKRRLVDWRNIRCPVCGCPHSIETVSCTA